MNNIRKIIVMSLMIAQLTLPTFAKTLTQAMVEGNTATEVVIPEFSVVIGNSVYDLNFANDIKNKVLISKAIVDNKGMVYIQTVKGTWINNETGTPVAVNVIDKAIITLSNAISELNSELNFSKTNNNEFTLKIPQVVKVYGVDSGLIFDKQVFDSLKVDMIKPTSIIKIAEFVNSGYNTYIITMPSNVVSGDVTISIDGLYLSNNSETTTSTIFTKTVK